MKRLVLLSLVPALAGAVAAQSNTVAGLNGRITQVDLLTYYGRRGPAHPNGEIGMAMLNEMCNPGSVTIPWYAAMQSNHPKFGFLVVRQHNGRLEQISDWSYCKHAFTSTNYTAGCGPCQNPGTGSVMGVNCADTYDHSHNADRFWLGPPSEIDPWLGTWNPVGSYFDRGDPPVTGAAANDGVRSLNNTAGFDSVKNRVTVQEIDLTTPGAQYFYGIHLIHQGEAGANRGDNLASRGFQPVYSGGSWSFSNNAVGQVYGSILQHWQGASIDVGGNGNDDGRFFVAVKVTPVSAGVYHYEYAVHNADNNRGGASFRVPVDPAATVSNFTFGDIDGNPLNDWLGQKVGSEIVFAATPNNPHNWNTIYNFGFDCSVPPSFGVATIDQARIGPGALTVSVNTQVPSGIPSAQVSNVGSGCGQCARSFYEFFGNAAGFDLANRSMTLALNGAGNAYAVGTGTGTFVPPAGTTLALGDDDDAAVALPFSLAYPGGTTTSLRVCSNGFVSVGAGNGTTYDPSVGAFLSGAPRWAAAWHDLNPGAGGQIRVDASAAAVRISFVNVPNFSGGGTASFQYQFLPNGTVHILWQAVTGAGNSYLVGYTPGGNATDPGGRDLSAVLGAGFALCTNDSTGLALTASARPILGTTVNLTTTNIPAGSPFGAVLLSLTQAVPPTDLTSIGMAGCFAHVVGGVTHLFVAPGASSVVPFAVPNDNAFTGLPVFAQSFTYSPPLTALGAIASNGVVMLLGPQ